MTSNDRTERTKTMRNPCPPEIFDALGLTFDLDPCSPGAGHWVPARNICAPESAQILQVISIILEVR